MNQALSLENRGTSGELFDKRLGTNLVAAALVCGGLWFNGPWRETLLNTGLFCSFRSNYKLAGYLHAV